jgi:FkbM family methyltransferase
MKRFFTRRFFAALGYAVLFPAYSLFNRRFSLTIFFPGPGGWWAFTRWKIFPVREPRAYVLEYFRRFVAPTGGTVFDVGGELGYETEQFSRMVGPTGHVVVFECLPAHILLLRAIALRRKNVQLVESACWDKATDLEFFVGHTPGSNTALPEVRGAEGQALANPGSQMLTVHADTLDALWQAQGKGRPVDFLKMDIEGAEYEALAGARCLLAQTRRAVVAAYHIRDGVRTADRVAELFRAAGFTVEIGDNHHVYAQRA